MRSERAITGMLQELGEVLDPVYKALGPDDDEAERDEELQDYDAHVVLEYPAEVKGLAFLCGVPVLDKGRARLDRFQDIVEVGQHEDKGHEDAHEPVLLRGEGHEEGEGEGEEEELDIAPEPASFSRQVISFP